MNKFLKFISVFAVLALAVGHAYGYAPVDMSTTLHCTVDWLTGFTSHVDGMHLAEGAAAGGTAEAVTAAVKEIRGELDKATADMRREVTENLNKQIGELTQRIADAEEHAKGAGDLKEESARRATANAELIAKIEEKVQSFAADINTKIDELQGRTRKASGPQAINYGDGLVKAMQEAGLDRFTDKKKAIYKVQGMLPHVMHRKDISATGSTVYEPMYVPGIIGPGERALRVRDLLPRNRTSQNNVYFVKETALTDNAGPQAGLGAAKGETTFNVTVDNEAVQTIAHFIQVPLQMLDDIPGLEDYTNGRMIFLLDQEEEDQLLYGDDTGQNLNGLMTQATAFDTTLLTELSVSSPTDIDKLRAAIAQVNVAEYPASGIVMHTYNWAGIEMLKDSEKRYIFAMPQDRSVPRMWGLPVVATTAMNSPDFLVGAFSLCGAIWDLQQSQIQISTEDSDNFQKNMATIRAEERITLTVYRALSLVEGDFDETVT